MAEAAGVVVASGKFLRHEFRIDDLHKKETSLMLIGRNGL